MRAIIVLIVLALAAAGGFYLLTMPSLAVRGPLPARTANLANGETMFQYRRLRILPRHPQSGR